MASRLLQLVLLLAVALATVTAHPRRHSRRHAPAHLLESELEVEQSSLTSLKAVEEKLDLILDAETREKKLIEGFLLYDNTPPKYGKIEQVPPTEEEQEENNQETSVITTSAKKSANTPRHPQRNPINGKEIKPDEVESVEEEKVEEEDSVNNERKLDKTERREEEVSSVSPKGPTTSETTRDQQQGTPSNPGNIPTSNTDLLVEKLEENSKRMETMVVFLADLRNVLSEAVGAQEKQVALKGEVIQLKEEIEYLREEMEKLRIEKTHADSTDGGKTDNKLKNDERTIDWLKTTVSELRHGLEEVSSSVNVTGLLHLRQQWAGEVSRVDGDLRELRKDVEALKGSGARNEEALVEIKGDIADLRTWHLKMGQKFSLQQEEQESGQISPEQPIQSLSFTSEDEGKENKEWRMRKLSQKKLTSSLLPSSDSPAMPPMTKETGNEYIHKNRHSKNRLRSDLKSLALVLHDVVRDQDILHKRFVKLDKKINQQLIAQAQQYATDLRRGRSVPSSKSFPTERQGASNQFEGGEEKNNVIAENSPRQGSEEEGMTGGVKNRDWRRHYHGKNSVPTDETFTGMRINSLERSMAQYGNTLEHVSDKVASLSQLQESSTQLFTALEALETKYDQRLTDMQTGLARLEASVSSTSIINDEIKAQQNLHSKEYSKLNKDFIQTRGQVETNHLRLAAVQSQMLRWGIKSCADTNNESIQNIKISSLEAKLR